MKTLEYGQSENVTCVPEKPCSLFSVNDTALFDTVSILSLQYLVCYTQYLNFCFPPTKPINLLPDVHRKIQSAAWSTWS